MWRSKKLVALEFLELERYAQAVYTRLKANAFITLLPYKYGLIAEQSQKTRFSGASGSSRDQRGPLNMDSRREVWEFPWSEAENKKQCPFR